MLFCLCLILPCIGCRFLHHLELLPRFHLLFESHPFHRSETILVLSLEKQVVLHDLLGPDILLGRQSRVESDLALTLHKQTHVLLHKWDLKYLKCTRSLLVILVQQSCHETLHVITVATWDRFLLILHYLKY